MGESSIHRDAAGRWHGYVSLGRGEGGGRDRRHVSARTRGEVVARVREIERKRDASSVPTAGRAPTVEAWLTHWLDSIAAARVRPLTLAGYRSKVEIHLLPHLGHVRLDGCSPNISKRSTRRCWPAACPARPSCRRTASFPER